MSSDMPSAAPNSPAGLAHDPAARRPLRSRDASWSRVAAGAAVRLGLSPNAISLASVG